MKIYFRRIVIVFAFLLLWFVGFAVANAQPATLSISNSVPPILTINGAAGATYQIQFTSQIGNSNQWNALTNILLENSSLALADTNAQSAAARFYRALLLSASTNFTGYAPDQLSPGEIYFFTNSHFGFLSIPEFVVESATNGTWLQSDSSPPGGRSAIAFQYTKSGPLTGNLELVFPPSNSDPDFTTNEYLLVFTGTNSGAFVGGPGPSASGYFSRSTTLVGKSVLPAQFSPGEVWQFSASNNFYGLVSWTLAFDSATNGWLFLPGNLGKLSAAAIQFIPQGLQGGTLTVTTPSGFPGPLSASNNFLIQFTDTNSGIVVFQSSSGGYILGAFSRNTTLVGKNVVPAQLDAGEEYQIAFTNPVSSETLVMETSTGGWWAVQGNNPSLGVPGIFQATAQITPIGPLSANLIVVQSGSIPNPLTNSFVVVFTDTNYGAIANSGLFSSINATFTRTTSFVGQSLAALQLTAGEKFDVSSSAFGGAYSNRELLIDSPVNGTWIINSIDFPQGLQAATVAYSRSGPFSANLTIVLSPASTGLPPSTNQFFILFASPTNGIVQILPGNTTAPFSHDAAFVGKSFCPPLLTPGEIYQVTSTGQTGHVPQTVVVNSAVAGLYVPGNVGQNSGLFPVALQYTPYGAFSANLSAIFDGYLGNPGLRTNSFFLFFTNSTAGYFLGTDSPGTFLTSVGPLVRNTNRVGQIPAPPQLAAGESYQFNCTNNQPTGAALSLVLDSPTDGFWVITGDSPSSGVADATVQYTQLGPLVAGFSIAIPPITGFPSGATNTCLVYYNTNNSGLYQITNNAGGSSRNLGTFNRTSP